MDIALLQKANMVDREHTLNTETRFLEDKKKNYDIIEKKIDNDIQIAYDTLVKLNIKESSLNEQEQEDMLNNEKTKLDIEFKTLNESVNCMDDLKKIDTITVEEASKLKQKLDDLKIKIINKKKLLFDALEDLNDWKETNVKITHELDLAEKCLNVKIDTINRQSEMIHFKKTRFLTRDSRLYF